MVSDLFTRSLPKREFQGGDHLTCKNTLNANIAISVATNKPVPKKRIFITIDTRLVNLPASQNAAVTRCTRHR